MHAIIHFAFHRSRAALFLLAFLLVGGVAAYRGMPKEAEPDVPIPVIYVSMSHEGISPEDAERLLVRPMEKELQSIVGLKSMIARAEQGHASVQLEFSAGFDSRRALDDVRERVDIAKAELPDDTDEPQVHEVNVALFPVLTIALSGPLPERALLAIARELEDRIEALPGVLEVDIGGDREQVLEILVKPSVMETYGVTYADLFSLIGSNNRLVAAGNIDTGHGRLTLEVPGVVESVRDALDLPVKASAAHVVRLGDVAELRESYKDRQGFARVNGRPAVTLEVKKRIGANIIETITGVRALVLAARPELPASLQVAWMQDKSREVRDMLTDLQNNVVSAIVLVLVVILAALGQRSALLIGVSIPGAFLATLLVLQALGFTLNIVVLFSLILVSGMLVDGAIVVVECAEQQRAAGRAWATAYRDAALAMAAPVTSSALTTIVVFLPLLFWPGVAGQFMKYLPATVIVALLMSLAMALVFVPVLGAALGRVGGSEEVRAAGQGLLLDTYEALLRPLLRAPLLVLTAAVALLGASLWAYAAFGRGVEFFPDVEPDFAQVVVRARGDLSIHEKDALVRQVEERLLGSPEVATVYARSFSRAEGQTRAEDVIGIVQLEFVDWYRRPPVSSLLERMRRATRDIPGVLIELRKAGGGPGGDAKPVEIEVSGRDLRGMVAGVEHLRRLMEVQGSFVDLEDDRPLPGIDWRLGVDRERAALHGADVATIGSAVQLLTAGIKVSEYRPDGSDDEVDLRVRYPAEERHLGRLADVRVPTPNGMVPLGNFVQLTPEPRTGTLSRVDARRVITLRADVAPGKLVDEELQALRARIAADPPREVSLAFKGEDEDQREAAAFLTRAFAIALFLMALVLLVEFNSVYQSLLVLSAVVFSTAGVLIGLLVTQQPFGIVMVGLGIIALAGIVVNNNIVLIEAFNGLRAGGLDARQAALAAARTRLRPVFLTAFTTVLGLMPMVLAMNVDIVGREVSFGAPSTQWWRQLASAIAGGLGFATLLTLFLTPCMLVLGSRAAHTRPAATAVTPSPPGTGVAEAV
jgi:multidrug efflux pump